MLRTAEDLAKEVEQLREAVRGRDATLDIQRKDLAEMKQDLALLQAKYNALREVVQAHIKYLSLTI